MHYVCVVFALPDSSRTTGGPVCQSVSSLRPSARVSEQSWCCRSEAPLALHGKYCDNYSVRSERPGFNLISHPITIQQGVGDKSNRTLLLSLSGSQSSTGTPPCGLAMCTLISTVWLDISCLSLRQEKPSGNSFSPPIFLPPQCSLSLSLYPPLSFPSVNCFTVQYPHVV